MFTRIKTATLEGVEGTAVTVETDVRMGLPSFRVVGLADTTIKEAGSRIKPAILNSGLEFPDKRVTVNLVPAGRHKEGTHFDLPIAVALMDIAREPEDTAFLGELSAGRKTEQHQGSRCRWFSASGRTVSGELYCRQAMRRKHRCWRY